MNQILIVEDEINLGNTLLDYLESQNFSVQHALNCQRAREMFNQNTAIVLMDIGLPDGDGIELAREFRNKRKDFILLFLSAQNDPHTKYEGLEMGAEDFITKPFDLRELTLRLKRVLKTQEGFSHHSDEISLGCLKFRFKNYEIVDSNGITHNLTQKECGILELLYKKMNTVVSRDEIISEVWGEDSFPSNRSVDNYIVKLRKWIETDTSKTMAINSIRGVGYQFEVKK